MQRIAVIGAGIAGITAAHLLQQKYSVTLLEKDARIGGHTSTVVVPDGIDAGLAVDTGFIVLNNQTYPLLHRLLREWNCPVRESNMSFGYFSEVDGFAYAGTGLNGLFARRRNLLRPAHYKFLSRILAFGRKAIHDLETGSVGSRTLAEYTRSVDPVVFRRYIVPMAAAIWSATFRDICHFPAESLLHFWRNHGLLSLDNRPVWQTVAGGSHSYLKAFQRSFKGAIRTSVSIESITRTANGVQVRHAGGEVETFDGAVIAAHADQALRLLGDPSAIEQNLLGAWSYQANRTILHTDETFMPDNRRVWASWNYVERGNARPDAPVPVTYWMNLLQGLRTSRNYLVTLNPDREPQPGCMVKEFIYHHPVYTMKATATQAELGKLQGVNKTWFCGSYFSHGFHEDAVRSGVSVAASLGVDFV